MVDPITTIGLGAVAAYLGKDGLEKLLGPTADYLGEGLRDITKRRVENIGRIFKKASDKLGPRIEGPGTVSPRVLKVIVNEGSYCDDQLAVEYFGGVLASSRTESGRDDRGARMAKLLDGLSTYQIRAHYLVYGTVRHCFSGKNFPFNMEGRPKMKIFLPYSGFFQAMDFDDRESQQLGPLLNHIFFGLGAENLIESQGWQYGHKESIGKVYADAQEGGIVCQPSALGGELYLWAFGQSAEPLEFIFDAAFDPSVEGMPSLVSGACGTVKAET